MTLRQILNKPKVDLNSRDLFDLEIIFINGKRGIYPNCTYCQTRTVSPTQVDFEFGNGADTWVINRNLIKGFHLINKKGTI